MTPEESSTTSTTSKTLPSKVTYPTQKIRWACLSIPATSPTLSRQTLSRLEWPVLTVRESLRLLSGFSPSRLRNCFMLGWISCQMRKTGWWRKKSGRREQASSMTHCWKLSTWRRIRTSDRLSSNLKKKSSISWFPRKSKAKSEIQG